MLRSTFPKELSMRSGPLVVSETDCTAESCKADQRTRKIQWSPFKVPPDTSIFPLAAKEKEDRKEETRRYLALPIRERVTYAGRLEADRRELRKELSQALGAEEDEGDPKRPSQTKGRRVGLSNIRGNTALRMAMIRGDNVEKESRLDYVTKKREVLRLEYSLMVKREEIQKLEEATVEEERRMRRAQEQLENDTLLFEEFLKENDKHSVEAIKVAENETKRKLEKMTEVKRLTAEIMTIKSKILKNEEILKEYKMYKDFLFKLSPTEWQDAQRAKAQEAKTSLPDARDTRRDTKDAENKAAHKHSSEKQVRELPPARGPRLSSRQNVKSPAQSTKLIPLTRSNSDGSGYEDEPELFFSEPQQLLSLLTELEEQNFSLIQNSRETEEALEELQRGVEINKKKMAEETEQLMAQIDSLSQTIAREKERAAQLELKARLCNFGKLKASEEDHMLDTLGCKVEGVYRCCVGDKKANLSTLQMLSDIESRLLALLESMESIPAETLERVERFKERERRIRQRDEKLREKKEHQEDRLKKALERSQADIKKTNGRRLMARSKPIDHKIKLKNMNDTSEMEEIHAYFFS